MRSGASGGRAVSGVLVSAHNALPSSAAFIDRTVFGARRRVPMRLHGRLATSGDAFLMAVRHWLQSDRQSVALIQQVLLTCYQHLHAQHFSVVDIPCEPHYTRSRAFAFFHASSSLLRRYVNALSAAA